jgi:hypothetical protein
MAIVSIRIVDPETGQAPRASETGAYAKIPLSRSPHEPLGTTHESVNRYSTD